ncbi:MAG: NUDIX domain-containing protein [Anaerolineae bacterium]|nr:NUDIX domain-containing protein [Anaerolineae bacterium]
MGAAAQGIDPARWSVIQRTLIFITNGDHVLLLKRGLHKRAFPGMYNGLGGHIERDEDPLTSARRELLEESNLSAADLRLRGVMHIDAGGAQGISLFIFTGSSSSRDVIDTDEGTLEWISHSKVNDLPLADDIPMLLEKLFGAGASDTLFFAHVSYDANDRRVTRFASA